MSITPDGKMLYVPSFEKDTWNVVDARHRRPRYVKVETNSGAHNTVVSLDGQRMYLGGLKSPILFVADTKTHKLVQDGRPVCRRRSGRSGLKKSESKAGLVLPVERNLFRSIRSQQKAGSRTE